MHTFTDFDFTCLGRFACVPMLLRSGKACTAMLRLETAAVFPGIGTASCSGCEALPQRCSCLRARSRGRCGGRTIAAGKMLGTASLFKLRFFYLNFNSLLIFGS